MVDGGHSGRAANFYRFFMVSRDGGILDKRYKNTDN